MAKLTNFFNPEQLVELMSGNLGLSLINLCKAILVLLAGLVIATLVRQTLTKFSKRRQLNNKLASVMEKEPGTKPLEVESWIAQLAYWTIILLTLVGFLQTLKLEAVAQPFNNLLNQVFGFLPSLAGAGTILVGVWAIATLVRILIKGVARSLKLDERLGAGVEGLKVKNRLYFSETLSNAAYWFIFLLFLPSVLDVLGLQGTLKPVQALLNDILTVFPNILAALIIGTVGWVVAGIIRQIVSNLLASMGVNAIGTKLGIAENTQSLAQVLGTIAYILVLIPIAIAALDALKIAAISLPATQMLSQIMAYLPKLFTAGIILALAYLAGRYAAALIIDILKGLGFDRLGEKLGFAATENITEGNTLYKSPAEIVGILTLLAVMLVATITAVDILQLAALETLLQSLLIIGGKVIIGLLVFALGLWLANLAFKIISSPQNRQAQILGQTTRIVIITFASAMALEQMGLASSIVNLAFGLLFGAIAVAVALAFGLGGIDIAGSQIESQVKSLRQNRK